MMKRSLFIFCTILMFSGIAGCGKQTVSVSGTITYQGKPAPDIQVFFQPTGDAPTMPEAGVGLTDASGRFTLSRVISKKKGVEPGPYTVFLSWKDPDADPNPIDGVTVFNKTIYPDIAKGIARGGLTFTVEERGTGQADFELTREPSSSNTNYTE